MRKYICIVRGGELSLQGWDRMDIFWIGLAWQEDGTTAQVGTGNMRIEEADTSHPLATSLVITLA